MLTDGLTLINNSAAEYVVIQSGTSFPQSPILGQLFYNTSSTDTGLYVYDGSSWALTNEGVTNGGGTTYLPGPGISINGNVISSTVKSDGSGPDKLYIQAGDGVGGFVGIIQPTVEGLVLTSHTTGLPTWEPAQVSGGTVTSVSVTGGTTGLTTSGGPITTSGDIELGGVLKISNGGTGATTVDGILNAIFPTRNTPGAALVQGNGGNLSWQVLPGSAYSAGTGISLQGTVINSTVADSIGTVNKLQLSKGDGTLKNLPSGEAGKVLTSNGETDAPTWEAISGTVSQIQIVRDPTMGLRISGGSAMTPPVPYTTEITTTGSITLAGVLDLEHGGTGVTDYDGFMNLIFPPFANNENKFLSSNGTNGVVWRDPFPPQSGKSGYFLTTNGTDLSWSIPAGGGTVISVAASGGTTGLTFSGGPITQSGTLTLGGVLGTANGGTGGKLPVAFGGTGADNAADAINNLVPSQGGQAGKILTTDGSTVSWTTSSAGSVLSVDIDPTTTGLTVSGGPITSTGTFSVGGVLAVAHGGTGATSANAALNALLPTQSGNIGNVLVTDGTNTSWQSFTDTILPPQSGNAGKFLSTDGTTPVWNSPLPAQSAGVSGYVLTSNGSIAEWKPAAGGTGNGSVSSVDVSGGTTGISFSGGPITSTGTLTMGGTLAIANGGTGGTTAAQAIANLLPSQSGNANKVLKTNGTSLSWEAAGSGTVTSIDISGGVTGLTFAGGPIVSNGTFTMAGTLAIANGGTGGNTAQVARNNLMPAQASKAGFVLTSDGTNMDWVNPSSLPTISGGADTNVQFNNNGALGGSAFFTWNDSTNTLSAANIAGNGSGLTSLNGTNISSGTVAPARLGSGTPSTTTFLRGDGSWATFSATAAGADTQIQYNNASAIAGSSDFTYAATTNTLTVGAVGNAVSPGKLVLGTSSGGAVSITGSGPATGSAISFTIAANNGSGSGSGGALVLRSGNAGTTAGANAGSISLIAGNSSGASNISQSGGNISLTAGNASSSASSGYSITGGNVVLTGGTANLGAGVGGNITLIGGSGNSAGGDVELRAGTSSTSAGEVFFTVAATERFRVTNTGRTDVKGGISLKRNATTYATNLTINYALGNAHTVTLTGDVTAFTFTNLPASGQFAQIMMFISQDTVGNRAIAWPTSIKWPSGQAPVLTASPLKTDIISLVTYDAGSTWFGSVVGMNYV